MKKTLLATLALAAACSAFALPQEAMQAQKNIFKIGPRAPQATSKAITRADGEQETFIFSYSKGPANGLSLQAGAGVHVYMMFKMEANDIKTFAGSKVIGFTVCSPTDYNGKTNSITEGRFFYTTDITKEEYTQDFSMSTTPFAENTVSVDTPYTITGEEKNLYFGYSIVTPAKDDMYYAVIDDVPNVNTTFMIGTSSNGESMPTNFGSYGSQYGALCMALTLEGDHFPKYVNFESFPSAICLPLGQTSSLPISLHAVSGTPVESVEIAYAIGGKDYTSTIEFNPAYNAGSSINIDTNIEFPAFEEKFNEDVQFNITKINGLENVSDGASATSRVVVVSEVPAHQTLFEEYTGTWCGYCTRGYAALEYIRENYPDFIVAAFHSGSQTKADPMQITNNFPTRVQGLPSAVLNRNMIVDPYYGTQNYDMEVPVVGDVLALNAVPSVWSVKVSHEWESEDILVATTEVANMAGFDNSTYKIAYLLVADGLSGKTNTWFQTNYYNTERPVYIPELNAFCMGGKYGKGSVSGLIFNDVVVSTTGIYGVAGSIPTSLESEQVSEHSLSFDISKIKADLIPDRNKLRVIAAVVDEKGVVLNCAKDEVNDYGTSAVESIDTQDAPVEYYNLNGMKVADPANGIYIRRQGSKTDKVIIK